MRLSTAERLILLNALPKQGSLVDLRIVRDLSSALSFSEEEQAELGFREENGRVQWRIEGEKNADVKMGPRAQDIVLKALRALDKRGELTIDQVDVYERFLALEKDQT